MSRIQVRQMAPSDWKSVVEIYQQGIDCGNATFEASPPSWDEFSVSKSVDHRWVALSQGAIVGWAALAMVSMRCVYRGVAEVSVYVDPCSQGFGIGSALMRHTVSQAEKTGIWTVQAHIFPENTASLRLHVAQGFTVVGTRSKLGKMTYGPFAGLWRDVVLLERRRAVD